MVGHRDPLVGSDAFLLQAPDKLESLTKQILDELGTKSELRDSRDILAVVGEELSAVSSSADYKNALSKAANRLRSPNRPFRFRVPISTGSLIGIKWELGGVDALEIRNCSPEGEPPLMELVGCIQAPFQNRVLDRVEGYIKSIAGTSFACGIARYYYARLSTVPIVRIEDSEEKINLDAGVGALAAGTVFGLPEDLDQIKTRRAKTKGLTDALGPTLNRIAYVTTSTEVRATALRSAAILFADAIAATTPGRSVTFALMALEAVLLERSNTDTILARLKEAVAYRLGRSPDERSDLRKHIGRLYEFRSSFVHTGEVYVSESQQRSGLELVRLALKREIDDLQPVGNA